MKLSVSAYRAHASAHKKILDTAYQLNYGSTSAHHPASGTSATCTPFQLDPPSLDAHAGAIGTVPQQSTAASLGLGGPIDEGASSDDARTPLHSPRSQNTSREEDESSNANESDCKSPNQRGLDSPTSSSLAWRPLERRRGAITSQDGGDGGDEAEDDEDGAPVKQAVQGWRNLRAVMAYYHSLRKIKRTKSNQRWMKLRTTVQISSAIQKKPPLKREDSFLQRFAARHQIPETQETVEDTGSEGGGVADKGGGASGGGGGGGGGGAGGRRRRHRRGRQPKTVINPDENFYFHWLLVLTVSVLYNMWTLIVRQSFPELQQMMSTFWILCDSSSDLFFLTDVVVQLRTGYLEQGLMVYDSRKLARHYVTSRAFLLDLAALCPLDLLQIRLGTQPLLRFPRFLKVYRAVNYYYMVESRTVYPNLWRVVNLIHILLILAHWFGCFYFLLSEAEGFQGDWVYPYRPGDYATLTRKYLGSLYWSTLTLTTIGDLPTPETNAEDINSVDGPRSLPRRGIKSRLLQFNTSGGYVFTIVSYLIGVFIFATIVGQVGNVITNRNANRLEFERLLDGAKTYMRHHKVPGGMKRRVLRWYDYSWSRGRIQGGGDINTALGLLPDKLKTELALHVNLTVLKKVTIFQECQPEFLRDLVLKMKAYIFTPGDSICRKGEVAREMFIIADGILEVISESGKILTTMKAGDFFGEIGILNLDGLNKRTADVRSVGYSELFSLSREDILNAMKDYPDAQEILQALGRKRLMEVKASARQHAKEMKDRADAKGLVDKIKSEAKGLRNALRKSRPHRHAQEEHEMQPLHPGSSSLNVGKGMLRRMPRVRSHDLSQEEQQPLAGDQEKPEEKVSSPLGAGLPLLSRLRLLKETQEHEERLTNCTTPSILSPSPATSMKSPPPTSATDQSTKDSQQTPAIQPAVQATEVIGAGLPLLQRLLLLKAKEDRLLLGSSQSQPTSPQAIAVGSSATATSARTRTSFSVPTARSSVSSTTSTRSSLSVTPSIVTKAVAATMLGVKPSAKVTFRERLSKLHPPKDTSSAVKDAKFAPKKVQQVDVPTSAKIILPSESVVTTASEVPVTPTTAVISTSSVVVSPSQTTIASTSSLDDNNAWLKLKKAALIQSDIASKQTDQQPIRNSDASVTQTQRTKPSLVLTSKHKQYRSIDDLSPEYGGLPFVKKLKILNERIKLEELETVMKTRSFSLDIPEASQAVEVDNLTRSQSEGSSMHHRGGKQNGKQTEDASDLLAAKFSSNDLHSSTESNETYERRQLRSILKKLSEETTPASTICATIDGAEFRRLMRAPTIEGYAARHSKLAKSVTFNRDTLQSPPSTGNVLQQQQIQGDVGHIAQALELRGSDGEHRGSSRDNIFQFPVGTGNGRVDVRESVKDNGNNNNKELVSRDMKLSKGSLEEDQQYFADILFAIKQVMSSHLQDIQDKYQLRCEELQRKLKEKNDTIEELKAHIVDLEHGADDSFTDSMETIINGPNAHLITTSWETTSHYESHDLSNLPQQTLTPKPLWHSPTSPSSPVYQQLTSPPPPHTTTGVHQPPPQSATHTHSTRMVGSALDRSASSCCVLDMDSNTDTDNVTDEEDDDEETLGVLGGGMGGEVDGSDGDEEEEEYENSSTNWEMEMLAAELRASRRHFSFKFSVDPPAWINLLPPRAADRGAAARAVQLGGLSAVAATVGQAAAPADRSIGGSCGATVAATDTRTANGPLLLSVSFTQI